MLKPPALRNGAESGSRPSAPTLVSMRVRLPVMAAVIFAFAGCADDELTPEQASRNESRCVKDTVGEAQRLEGEVGGFDKWNRLAAYQRRCIEEGAQAILDAEGD